jgi:hypothetical protein
LVYIRKVQDKQEGLELNGLNQVVIYADDVKRFDCVCTHTHTHTVKNNAEIPLQTSKEIHVEVNKKIKLNI